MFSWLALKLPTIEMNYDCPPNLVIALGGSVAPGALPGWP